MKVDSADLVYYLWNDRVLAFQLPLNAMTTGRLSLLTLGFQTGSAQVTAKYEVGTQEAS